MRAIRGLFALLLLVSLGFGFVNISGNQSSYNPGDILSLTIFSNNATAGENVYINLVNASLIINCSLTSEFNSDNISSPSCVIPSNLANGSWNISVSKQNAADINTSTFMLNYTLMSLNISPPGNYSPGSNFTLYVNMSYLNSSPFNINTSAFNFSVNSNISCSLLLSNTTAGNYTSTCNVNSTALAGIYTLNGIYPNAKADDTFGVNISYRNPRITSMNQSFSFDNSEQRNITINITSGSNYPDIINLTNDCDGTNLICSLDSTAISVAAFGNFSVLLTINSTASAASGVYAVNVTAMSLNETSKTNRTSISVTINPFHNFSMVGNSPSQNTTTPAGGTATYSFNISSRGNTTTYNFSCNSSSINFTCIFNYANNTQISEWANLTVSLNVTMLNHTPLGEAAKTDVYVTDAYGLRKVVSGTYFTTTAAANLGNVVVTNISQYVHYAGETYNFNVSVNNTGNFDGNDTIFNITVVAQNTAGWIISVSNGSTNLGVNDTSTLNFMLNINNLSSKNISVQVTVPSTATYQNFTKLFINATSAINATRSSENASVLIKIPYYNFSVNMVYNNSVGSERLNWSIVNVTREPGVAFTSFSNLSYSITQSSNGTLQIMDTSANTSTGYWNSTTNSSNWPSGGYIFNVWGNTSDTVPYNFNVSAPFYIARTVALSATVPASVDNGQPFNVTVSSLFGGTTISTNTTTTQYPVVSLPSGGGTCPSFPTVITNSTYIYICTASTSTNASYSINISSAVSYCSRWFNCTFNPIMVTTTYISVSEFIISGGGAVTPGAGGGGSNNTQNVTMNQTISTTAGLKFTIPGSTINLQNNSYTFSIVLNNTNNSRQNLSVTVGENGDYLHFRIAYIVPLNISGNSVSTLNITLTPFKWAKPGTYVVSVRINSATGTLVISVPQPTDTKSVHRYVEVNNARTMSNITLAARNRNAYSVVMNITENIPKQIAQSMANITVLSDLNYTVVENDPIIMWNMNMSSNQERTVSYSLKGDLGDSSLFNEPTLLEERIITPTGGGVTTAGGWDWTMIIIVIVVLLAVAGGVVFYFFFMRKGGEKMPFNYAVFLGEVRKDRGIFAAIRNIPHALLSSIKGNEAKEPKPVGPGISEKIKGVLGRLKRKKVEEKPKEEPKAAAKEAKPKPSKEELLDKLKEVYKK